MGAAGLHSLTLKGSREPKIGLREDGDVVGEDSDNRARLVVERNRFSNNVWIAAKPFLPQVTAEDYNQWIRGLLICELEDTAITRLNAKCIKEAGRHHRAFDLNGLVTPRQIEKGISPCHSTVVFKGMVLRSIIDEIGWRHRGLSTQRTVSPRPHKARGIVKRQRPKQYGVHNGKERGVGTDAQGQRENCDKAEARRLTQHAQAEAGVMLEVLPPNPAVGFIELFLRSRDVAKCPPRLSPRLFLGSAVLPQAFRLELDVRINFRAEIICRPFASEHKPSS